MGGALNQQSPRELKQQAYEQALLSEREEKKAEIQAGVQAMEQAWRQQQDQADQALQESIDLMAKAQAMASRVPDEREVRAELSRIRQIIFLKFLLLIPIGCAAGWLVLLVFPYGVTEVPLGSLTIDKVLRLLLCPVILIAAFAISDKIMENDFDRQLKAAKKSELSTREK